MHRIGKYCTKQWHAQNQYIKHNAQTPKETNTNCLHAKHRIQNLKLFNNLQYFLIDVRDEYYSNNWIKEWFLFVFCNLSWNLCRILYLICVHVFYVESWSIWSWHTLIFFRKKFLVRDSSDLNTYQVNTYSREFVFMSEGSLTRKDLRFEIQKNIL